MMDWRGGNADVGLFFCMQPAWENMRQNGKRERLKHETGSTNLCTNCSKTNTAMGFVYNMMMA